MKNINKMKIGCDLMLPICKRKDLLSRCGLMLFATVLVLGVSSIGSVYAQNSVGNDDLSKFRETKVLELDNILIPSITATLTGLSLTGASFLLNLVRNANQDQDAIHVGLARKSFIKAFFMFLVCTIVLFAFDFLEILYEQYVVVETIFDILITYALFAAGTIYLVKAAKELYFTYGR